MRSVDITRARKLAEAFRAGGFPVYGDQGEALLAIVKASVRSAGNFTVATCGSERIRTDNIVNRVAAMLRRKSNGSHITGLPHGDYLVSRREAKRARQETR